MSNRLYTTIPTPKVPRNTFNRSHPNTLSMHFQKCVPSWLEEILPGDFYRVGIESFARLQPMIAPVMNNMRLSHHFFFVPLRTLNNHFAEFMFNNRTGDYSEVLPYVTTANLYSVVELLDAEGESDLAANVVRMYDFIGLPFRYASKTSAGLLVANWLEDTFNTQVKSAALRVNLAPFFAATKIWSEYYRDENVMEDPFVEFEQETGENVKDWTGLVWDSINVDHDTCISFAKAFLSLKPRAWAHDRFTSSLPFAQRGPDVLLPIAGTATVDINRGLISGNGNLPASGDYSLTIEKEFPGPGPIATFTGLDNKQTPLRIGETGQYPVSLKGDLDFSDAALTTTINSFRRAERLQRWYENSARGGVRPNEATLAHFGVRTPDATLDRAEFLGGHMQPIVVSEVAQTSETTQSSPQGTLAGKGTSYKGGSIFKAYFTEHGFVMCFTSALVRANYWQGIPKVFSRMQRDEYYWPEFANLGEEPVFTKEIFAGTGVDEDSVFGYVPRYSDYKSAIGECHGDMRSDLSFWTQTREFANKPELNEEFLFAKPSLSPFAVQSQYTDPIILTMNFSVRASRLMPFYGVPTI